MIDWTKQTEQTFKAWTETQQKMWNSWLEMAQQASGQALEPAAVWQKSIETWEQSVQNTLEAQSKWTQMWAESLSNTIGVPKEIAQLAQQAQEMNQNWNQAQRQLWQSWFALAKNIDPASMSNSWETEGKKAFETWQETAQKMMNAQAEWSKMWNANSPSN